MSPPRQITEGWEGTVVKGQKIPWMKLFRIPSPAQNQHLFLALMVSKPFALVFHLGLRCVLSGVYETDLTYSLGPPSPLWRSLASGSWKGETTVAELKTKIGICGSWFSFPILCGSQLLTPLLPSPQIGAVEALLVNWQSGGGWVIKPSLVISSLFRRDSIES